MAVTRRQIVIGTLVGGGLAVGYHLRPRRFALPLSAGRNETAFDAWIKISRDGLVTVAVPQLEMGQGITTLIPQIVATELGADWRQVAVEPAPLSPHYANVPLAQRWSELWLSSAPILGKSPTIAKRWAEDNSFMATADGMSLAAYEAPAREAAASVRAVLAMAAADRWGVNWKDCSVANSFVSHGAKRLAFGLLAEEAAGFSPPDPPVLRAGAAQQREADRAATDQAVAALPIASAAFPRLDLPAKVDGSYTFAGDVRLPGMVYAAIRHGPIGDSELASFDKGKAKGITGLISLVKGKRWLAAVAQDWWAAERALLAIAPTFQAKQRADTAKIETQLDKGLLHSKGHALFSKGNAEGMAKPPYDLAVRYDVAAALHATLETATATARYASDKLELWIASQAPDAVRKVAAEAVGLSAQQVVIYPLPAGGSFDRRLENDHAVEAAIIAKEVGKPVQLTWSRWQEYIAGWPRTPVVAVLAAKTANGAEVMGWKARLALPASTLEFGHRLFAGQTHTGAIAASADQPDAMALDGAVPAYSIPDMVIEHVPVSIALPTARLRGNAHGYTAFFTESFIDELAHDLQREPLSFRIGMLGSEPRLAQCLQRVATLAEWDAGADASGQGLACHMINEGRIAVIATARRGENGVRVDKICAAVDIGRIINLDIARQQIEGGLIFGLGLALGSSTPYINGLPESGRLRHLGLPILADCPEVSVAFIDSDADPADPGELGVAAVAPAVANALFSATGMRFRRLPLISDEI